MKINFQQYNYNKFNYLQIQNHQTAQTKTYNKNTLEQEINLNAILNKNLINFKAKKFNLNSRDIIFLNSMIASLGLSSDIIASAKEALSHFLQDYNIKSIEDLNNEEDISKQIELGNFMSYVLNIQKDKYKRFFLLEELHERCISGNSYITPSRTFEEAKIEYKIREEDLKAKNQEEKEIDKKFIKNISYALMLNKDQVNKLTNIIQKTIKENDFQSLLDLENDDNIEVNAIMNDKIFIELNLNEEQMFLFNIELNNRLIHNEKYKPIVHPIDNNKNILEVEIPIINKIIEKYNINENEKDNFIWALKVDSYNNNYTSIMEMLKNNFDINKCPNTREILNNKTFDNVKNDLLIELYISAKNINKIKKDMETEKDTIRNNYEKNNALVYLLDKRLNLSNEQIVYIRNYLRTINSYNVEDYWKIAYEISDFLKLSSSQTKEIVEDLNIIDQANSDEISDYNFEYTQMLLNKHK